MICFGMSDKGPVREKNEDNFAYEQIGEYMCMAVADGLGGEVCGEVASLLAVRTALEELGEKLPGASDEDLGKILNTVFQMLSLPRQRGQKAYGRPQ